MKTLKPVIILLSLLFLIPSGAVTQQVVASAGGYFENDNISLSWTLGETVIATYESNDIILTQGFQQPYNFYLGQVITIPAGWSGVSSWVDPLNKGVDGIFSPHIPDFVILASMTEFYYPDGGVNSIGNWSTETGYQIKSLSEFEFTLTGSKIDPPQVELAAGWNLIPVLTPCGASTDELFSGITSLNIVKEVAGTGVYWPEFGITTLAGLEPGKAYWASVTEATAIVYPECTKNRRIPSTQSKPQNYSPWNIVKEHASSHVVVFPAGVVRDAGIQPGDYLGAFTSDNRCAGWVEVADQNTNLALVVFADDATTPEKDGFAIGETLQYKIYHPQTDEQNIIKVDYLMTLPQLGKFTDQGLSAVKSIEKEMFGTSDLPGLVSDFYPNPSRGIFTLKLNYQPDTYKVDIVNSGGEKTRFSYTDNLIDSGRLIIDLRQTNPGVYYCILQTRERVQILKLIKI